MITAGDLLLFERLSRAVLISEASPTELWAHCSCSIHITITVTKLNRYMNAHCSQHHGVLRAFLQVCQGAGGGFYVQNDDFIPKMTILYELNDDVQNISVSTS